jgi:hypothetical protein
MLINQVGHETAARAQNNVPLQFPDLVEIINFHVLNSKPSLINSSRGGKRFYDPRPRQLAGDDTCRGAQLDTVLGRNDALRRPRRVQRRNFP